MGKPDKWTYYTARCYYKETRKADVFSRYAEGIWVLDLEQEYPLAEGLNAMGSRGFELVAIQPAQLRHGGSNQSYYEPVSIYIFKQRIDG
jgi:hypothetical protein